jgi:hypothetical protein
MKHFCSIKNEHLLLTLFTGTTSAQRKLAAASLRRAVRQSVRQGCWNKPAVDLRTSTREGPVGADARRVALGSAGHLERLRSSRRRRKNNRSRLEELG